MADIKFADLEALPQVQAEIICQFMYELTIEGRDIYYGASEKKERQFYGLNQVYHMMTTFLQHLLFDTRTSYTTEIVVNNLKDMGNSYGIDDQIARAWARSLTYARLRG